MEGSSNWEIREVYYERLAHQCRYPNNVGVRRLCIIQGDPETDEQPRYVRMQDNPPPSEADGRILVLAHPLQSHFYGWARLKALTPVTITNLHYDPATGREYLDIKPC